MGMSPLEGLVMGTRSGDVDPSLGAYLDRVAGLGVQEFERTLNKESGLLGLAGVSDLRVVEERAAAGDEDAELALEVMVHRLVKYIGAYAAVLGRVDAVVFTGGIGQNSSTVRARLADRLGLLGVQLDPQTNAELKGVGVVTASESRTAMLVVPTNEELEIALEAAQVVGERG